jgi:hypothetical protein
MALSNACQNFHHRLKKKINGKRNIIGYLDSDYAGMIENPRLNMYSLSQGELFHGKA